MPKRGSRVWLWRSHPNFFFIYAATAVFHLAQAAAACFGGPGSVNTPSLYYVNQVGRPRWWAAAFAIVAVLLVAGLFHDRWTTSRVALALGAALTLFRALLIAMSVGHGTWLGLTGVPTWALVAALHLSQTAEPPVNPATSR